MHGSKNVNEQVKTWPDEELTDYQTMPGSISKAIFDIHQITCMRSYFGSQVFYRHSLSYDENTATVTSTTTVVTCVKSTNANSLCLTVSWNIQCQINPKHTFITVKTKEEVALLAQLFNFSLEGGGNTASHMQSVHTCTEETSTKNS